MKTILITGGSGFIGKNFKAYFPDEKYKVLTPSHQFLPLEDELKVDEFFCRNAIDYIIHTAVKPFHRAAKDTDAVLSTNLRMYFNLVKQMRKHPVKRMLVTGSGSEYGIDSYIPDMEEAYFGTNIPRDDGTFSRYIMAEHIEQIDLPVYNMRIFGVFGKYEDYRIRFISNAICKLLYDIPITLKQDRVFSYVYIDDLCQIVELMLTADLSFKTYNITPNEKYGLLDIAKRVRAIAGKPEHEIKIFNDGLGTEYSGQNGRLCTEFPDIRFMNMDDSIYELIQYYKSNLDSIDRNELLFDR